MATKSPQHQVKPIHFFKIITFQNLHEGKLMVPDKFVEKYGESLPNSLLLKTPNGAEWKLNLEKWNGKIWFREGWKEFAEYHSLAHGHLLVFRCQTISLFQVYILDLSALEIDYPSKRVQGGKASNFQGNRPPNEEILEYHRPGQKRKQKSAVDFPPLYSVKVENTVMLPKEALHLTDTNCKEKSKVTANQVSALDRASSFKSLNPFFLVVMHPTHVSRCHLTVPLKFGRRHFDLHMKQGFINLQVLNGSVLPAK
ncbi:hypothetical protein Fmac_003065 [Flemingia macrophylla]|uniref:TF-B3 domain-containing protein n=1 Tax=Flemingia macrophylla TaxID=520843 RepID=A0ABD1NLQ2_9FABA